MASLALQVGSANHLALRLPVCSVWQFKCQSFFCEFVAYHTISGLPEKSHRSRASLDVWGFLASDVFVPVSTRSRLQVAREFHLQ